MENNYVLIYLICFSMWLLSSVSDVISKVIMLSVDNGGFRKALKKKIISPENLYIGFFVEFFRMLSLTVVCSLIAFLIPENMVIKINEFPVGPRYLLMVTPFIIISAVNTLSVFKNLTESLEEGDTKYFFYKRLFDYFQNKVVNLTAKKRVVMVEEETKGEPEGSPDMKD